jgi:hypothetical protein
MTPLQDPDNSLDEILAAYLESSEMGKPMDQCELLARHPEWASQLAAFFADRGPHRWCLRARPGGASEATWPPVPWPGR